MHHLVAHAAQRPAVYCRAEHCAIRERAGDLSERHISIGCPGRRFDPWWPTVSLTLLLRRALLALRRGVPLCRLRGEARGSELGRIVVGCATVARVARLEA